ncbi:nucleotide exchange factor GrpE [bacterium]|nr:nucleotide exchange factor GrpE [bacterium]
MEDKTPEKQKKQLKKENPKKLETLTEKNSKAAIEELKEALKKCEDEKNRYLAGWQRERANFLNYKKEETKRVEELVDFARGEIILKVISIFDDLENAKKQIPNIGADKKWLEGISLIEQKFNKFLQQEGVQEIKAKNEKFNPNFHEAVEEVKVAGKKTGEILEVFQKGYLIKGRVLRPSKVRVVK